VAESKLREVNFCILVERLESLGAALIGEPEVLLYHLDFVLVIM
jgi:hypothetical protein